MGFKICAYTQSLRQSNSVRKTKRELRMSEICKPRENGENILEAQNPGLASPTSWQMQQ